jgi:hypothetical protein
MPVVPYLHLLTSIIDDPSWYYLAIPQVCFQRSDLDQPELSDFHAFEAPVS